MKRQAVISKVRPHPFLVDAGVPADWTGRRWCFRCHLPGEQGDERHSVADLSDDYRAADAARLGERVA